MAKLYTALSNTTAAGWREEAAFVDEVNRREADLVFCYEVKTTAIIILINGYAKKNLLHSYFLFDKRSFKDQKQK